MTFEALAAADLAYALRTTGVKVTLGALETYGLVRHGGVEVLEDPQGRELSSRSVTVLIATDSLPGLEAGATIVAGGTTYLVREHAEESAGGLTRIYCVKER